MDFLGDGLIAGLSAAIAGIVFLNVILEAKDENFAKPEFSVADRTEILIEFEPVADAA